MIRLNNHPTRSVLYTSEFGMREHPITGVYKLHNGLDIAPIVSGKAGDPISTVADGTVSISKADSGDYRVGYGYYVVVQHNGFATLYAHLQRLEVKVGQEVSAGELIGYMGSTGLSTAPHLHFGIAEGKYAHDFKWVNPLIYINKMVGGNELTEKEVRAIVYEMLIGANTKPSPWAEQSWKDATTEGIVDGSRPKGYATRQEVATMIMK